jgi:molybdopterin converting factor small subunit
MTVTLRPYGHLTDIPGLSGGSLELDFPLETGRLRGLLDERFPPLKTARFRIAVDHRLPADGEILQEARELALLPPASGG